MGTSLFKYVGSSNVDRVFATKGLLTLKCGTPAEFNDPYELFLTMNFRERPELIAFYTDVIGQLPQLPTTCFSTSPSVAPMWAHYASNLEGFVLELDEIKVSSACPQSGFGDVDYRDKPSSAVAENLYRAYEIGKFRYMHFLQRSVFSAAYYTKQRCWAYEKERRMILDKTEVQIRNGLTLVDLPIGTVKSLISGPRASDNTVSALRAIAKEAGCRFWQMRIGRSTGVPYFVDDAGEPAVFKRADIVRAKTYCACCTEPTSRRQAKLCSWCRIDDSHRENAAQRNSYRILHQFGQLDSYLESVNDIARRARRENDAS
jgi:Protein of unknown function (DUF2971)